MKIVFQIFLYSLFFLSCHKDEDRRQEINDSLQGQWKINVWTIDGHDEFRIYISSQVEFIRHSDVMGKTIWTTVTDSSGYTSILESAYEIRDNGRSIYFTGDLPEGLFTLNITNNEFKMIGNVGSHVWTYEASRN
ncbi:MAG: hypothetical protein ABIQ02_01795 [Saprospiraceae bacterium]